MPRKIKLPAKVNIAEPVIADEVRLVSIQINFREESFVARVAMIDTDDDTSTIVKEHNVHMGLDVVSGLNIDQIERKFLEILKGSGVLPISDGTIED